MSNLKFQGTAEEIVSVTNSLTEFRQEVKGLVEVPKEELATLREAKEKADLLDWVFNNGGKVDPGPELPYCYSLETLRFAREDQVEIDALRAAKY